MHGAVFSYKNRKDAAGTVFLRPQYEPTPDGAMSEEAAFRALHITGSAGAEKKHFDEMWEYFSSRETGEDGGASVSTTEVR